MKILKHDEHMCGVSGIKIVLETLDTRVGYIDEIGKEEPDLKE